MTTRRLAPLLLGLAAAAVLSGCGPSEREWPEKGGLKVVATFPPLADFATSVAGGRATVRCLCEGPNVEVEDYDPSPEDAVLLRQADVLFANGLGVDDEFTNQLLVNSPNAPLKVVTLGDRVKRVEKSDDATDTHLWMNVNDAVEMVRVIRDTLQEADPAGAADYDTNAQKYIDELNKLLDDKDAVELAEKTGKVVGLHEPLDSFLANFGKKLRTAGTIELGPDGLPTSRGYDRLAELFKTGKADLVAAPNDAAAKNLPDELKKRGVTDLKPPFVVVIDPLESADAPDGPHGYVERMRANFHRLNISVK